MLRSAKPTFEAHMTHLKSVSGSSLEDLSHALASLGRALHVTLRSNLLRNSETFWSRHRSLVHSGKILHRLWVVSKILLASDQDDRQALAKVQDLGNPLRNESVVVGGLKRTFSWTLSNESGESMAKQIKMTCESGYDRGRRRLHNGLI